MFFVYRGTENRMRERNPSKPNKATHQQTKTHNSRLVFETILNHDKISRAEVARMTGLTRTTVSDVVSNLIEKELALEVGLGISVGGKIPILLSVNPNGRHMIGIDLGDTEFRGAIVNLRGEIIHTMSLALENRDGEEALELAHALIVQLMTAATRPILGIGIGAPGIIDSQNGKVLWAVNLNWHDLPLRQLFQERHGLPVYIANDSQVGALAERMYGAHKNIDNLVVINVGRGLGAGIILHGELFQGDGYGAGEIGHVTVVPNGRACRCGNAGCLETVASNASILMQAQAAASRKDSAFLSRYADSPDTITAEVLRQAYEAGDGVVREILQAAGHYLGIAIANLVSIVNVKKVLIAGGGARLDGTLLHIIRQEVYSHYPARLAQQLEIETATLGDHSILLGASALLFTSELDALVQDVRA
jgi:N-acetylglucosamine repressor